MIDTRKVIPDRMLRQESITANQSSVGYPGAFETWHLVHSGSKESLGFLSFHAASASPNDVVIKFCRFLPESPATTSRCYTLNLSKKASGVRALLRQAVRSYDDPYLDPRVVDPAPEVYRDEPKAEPAARANAGAAPRRGSS